jgi:hypothetical protein
MTELIIFAIVALCVLGGVAILTRKGYSHGGFTFSNAAPRAMTTHDGIITRSVESAVTSRYLLAKVGTSSTAADIAGATDRPLGVFLDSAPSIGDICPVMLFGCPPHTMLMVPSVAVSQGDVLYTAASGKVTNVSATGAYAVGIALTNGVVDGIVEVDPRASLTAES